MYKVTKVVARALLRALSAPVTNTAAGLCWHAYHGPKAGLIGQQGGMFPQGADYLTYLFKQWPEFSGSTMYPVPGPRRGDPQGAYNFSCNKWVGPYGATRERLRQFCIDQCKLRLASKKDA